MRRFAGLAGLIVLAGCSSLSVPSGGATAPLNFAADDMAELLLAFDLPEAVEPGTTGPQLGFAVSARGETRPFSITLVRSDAGELAGTLPPPSDGRLYYLFGFSDADKAALRETRTWAGAEGTLSLTAVDPKVCAVEAVEAAKVRFTVQLALPGKGSLAPLVSNRPLDAAPPPCPGHSG